MGKLLVFPRRPRSVGDPELGCVHCWSGEDGGFEISHESRSGSSWGSIERFDEPQDAVAAAYDVAYGTYGGCDVYIAPAVAAACPQGPELPPIDQGRF